MNVATRTAWQNYTYDDEDVPSFEKLLEFVDWRAKASECVSEGGAHKCNPAASYKRFSTRPSYTLLKMGCVGNTPRGAIVVLTTKNCKGVFSKHSKTP